MDLSHFGSQSSDPWLWNLSNLICCHSTVKSQHCKTNSRLVSSLMTAFYSVSHSACVAAQNSWEEDGVALIG